MSQKFVTSLHFEFSDEDKALQGCKEFFCNVDTLKDVRLILGKGFLFEENDFDKDKKKFFRFVEGFGNFYQNGVNGFGEVSYTLENEYFGKITINPEYYNEDYNDIW